MNGRILVVEDEIGLAMTLKRRLQREEHVVSVARFSDSGPDMAIQGRFDLLILDRVLPRQRGLRFCEKSRQLGLKVPILMLTGRRTMDRVIGLQSGADDCLSKPFEIIELVARVDALVMRARRPQTGQLPYDCGDLDIGGGLAQVAVGGRTVLLSPLESRLLRHFLEHRGVTLSRDELRRQVWLHKRPLMTRTVDVHIAWLRKKIEKDPSNPRRILTVFGFGYKFVG
jgi:DNA-binding response OmpR family regulator